MRTLFDVNGRHFFLHAVMVYVHNDTCTSDTNQADMEFLQLKIKKKPTSEGSQLTTNPFRAAASSCVPAI